MSTPDAIDLPLTLGQQLAAARRNLHLSQDQLGDLIDVHRNTIGRWERGEDVPGFDFVVWLSTASGWPLHMFARAMQVTLPWEDPNGPDGLGVPPTACNGDAQVIAFPRLAA